MECIRYVYIFFLYQHWLQVEKRAPRVVCPGMVEWQHRLKALGRIEIARWMGMYIWFERFILIFLVSVRTLEKAMHHTKRCKQTFKYSSLFFLGSRGNINIISFWASSWRFARKASSEACQMEKQKLEVQTGNDAGCIAAVELLKMLRKGIWIFTEFTFFWRLTKCWWFQWFFFKIT